MSRGLTIQFPPNKEAQLIEEMKRLARPPWQWQENDPNLIAWPDMEWFCFHRDAVGDDVSCTLFLSRDNPGTIVSVAVVPDKGSTEFYFRILGEFERHIAEPAADSVEGMTALDMAEPRLEDYFSPEAVRRLELFCMTSNKSTLGTHPSDQEKWMLFLLTVYRENAAKKTEPVSGDFFGRLLELKKWWPEEGIDQLAQEYDFAMLLLGVSGGRR